MTPRRAEVHGWGERPGHAQGQGLGAAIRNPRLLLCRSGLEDLAQERFKPGLKRCPLSSSRAPGLEVSTARGER